MAIPVGCWLVRPVICDHAVCLLCALEFIWSSTEVLSWDAPECVYMKGVEAGTWLVVVLDTDPNGTHGHNEKKKKNQNTLEGLFFSLFQTEAAFFFCQDAQEQCLYRTGTPTWS